MSGGLGPRTGGQAKDKKEDPKPGIPTPPDKNETGTGGASGGLGPRQGSD
jgi:hypothetical protein